MPGSGISAEGQGASTVRTTRKPVLLSRASGLTASRIADRQEQAGWQYPPPLMIFPSGFTGPTGSVTGPAGFIGTEVSRNWPQTAIESRPGLILKSGADYRYRSSLRWAWTASAVRRPESSAH